MLGNIVRDYAAWMAACIGLSLMVLTLYFDVNPIEGSVDTCPAVLDVYARLDSGIILEHDRTSPLFMDGVPVTNSVLFPRRENSSTSLQVSFGGKP